MANFNARQSAGAGGLPSAAEAKPRKSATARSRQDVQLAEAASKAGRTTLANQLVDLGRRVEDREITLEEGMVELRDYEKEIRAMLKR